LIVEHQVNGIIHLAARAGVRSSIDNPGKWCNSYHHTTQGYMYGIS
jgi:UDP-glucose 4-epimerase